MVGNVVRGDKPDSASQLDSERVAETIHRGIKLTVQPFRIRCWDAKSWVEDVSTPCYSF